MELAIVLVIIGLIVGGILVGSDLVRSSEINKTVATFHQYNAAIKTFRLKYGALPGDLPAASATGFGFTTRSGARARGDNNGLIEGYSTVSGNIGGIRLAGGEVALFWVDLTTANGLNINLIPGSFSTTGVSVAATQTDIATYYPQIPIAPNQYLIAGCDAYYSGTWQCAGHNYLIIQEINSFTVDGIDTSKQSLRVDQANGIDNKIDDGVPTSGKLTARYSNQAGFRWNENSGVNGVWDVVGTNAYSTAARSSLSTRCFHNGNVAGATMKYAMDQTGGSNAVCAIAYEF